MTTRLEIVSDPVCPWCYLGAANLLRAVGEDGRHPFALAWRPFQLDPTLPPEGVDRGAYLRGKFGGDPARVDAVHARIAAMGAEVGIRYAWERIARAPNTLDAHRLLRWAAPEGLQTRTAMALFRRYFELGEDIGDPAVLAAAGEEAGLDARVVARLLAGDADRAEVLAEVEALGGTGVEGVPTFLLAGRYAIAGAQPPAFWADLIGRIEAAGAAPG